MSSCYPLVDIHRESGTIAVGFPHIQTTGTQISENARDRQEVIAVYHLNTGVKKRSLSLGHVFYELAGQWTSTQVPPSIHLIVTHRCMCV